MNITEKRKIKILLVVCNNVLNGTERYVVDLAGNLSKDIFEVTVATPMKGPLSDILGEKGIKEVIYNNDKLQSYSLKGLRNIGKILKNGNFDVLHGNSGILPCVVGRLKGVPFVLEVKHGIFYSREQLDSLNFIRRRYEIIKQFFVHKFLATSPNDKALIIKYFHTPVDKIDVIYLGLDIPSLRSKIKNSNITKNDEGDFIIGHIGRMTFQKAQIILLKAFKIVNDRYPNTKLIIVGEGEDKNDLLNFVRQNGLENKIEFKGYIADIYNEMMKFDAHVLTSRFEGMGYVNLEAMELGIPVITTDVGGASNFLTNEYNALITPVEDPQSTADAIEKLITNDKLRKDIIKNAAQTVKEYSIERMVKETSDFYIRNLN